MDITALFTPLLLVPYILGINGLAFGAFGLDKMLAEAGAHRIPESTLLGLAFLGGSPGAYAGRHLFRHKTRKQPFSSRLYGIVVVQAALLVFGAVVML